MSQEQYVTVNGIQLSYRIAGSGPPLVIQAPGWGFGGAFHEATFAPLREHHTVIAYDPRGSGQSQAPVRQEDMNVGMMVEDLDALRDYLGLATFALIGHSHGGYIALNYAQKYKDRLSQLILVDPQVGWPEVDADLQRNLPKLAVQERYAEAVRMWQSGMTLKSDADFAAWLRGVIPLYFHNPDYGVSLIQALHHQHPALAALRATQATDQQFPVCGRVTQLHMPTLVLVGRHDFITSPEQATILTKFGADLHIFEHSGHFPWIEEPDAFFNTIHAWLAQQQVDQLTA